MIGYDKITFDTKAPITDACIFVQFHYVDNKWDPCIIIMMIIMIIVMIIMIIMMISADL